MTDTLIFRLACEPDTTGLRAQYALPADLADFEVIEYALQKRRAAGGPDRLPAALQRIAGIACAVQGPQGLRIESWFAPALDENTIIQRLFDEMRNGDVSLVSWSVEDLSTLYQRALIRGCRAGHVPGQLPHLVLERALSPGMDEFPAIESLARLCGLPVLEASLGAAQRCEAEVLQCHQLWLRYQRLIDKADQAH